MWDNGTASHQVWTVLRPVEIPPDVKNALAGVLEGRIRAAVSNQVFKGEETRSHEEKIGGVTVAEWSEEIDWDITVSEVNFNMGSMVAGVNSTATTTRLILNFNSNGEAKGHARYKVPRVAVASVKATGRANLSGQAVVGLHKDGGKITWDASFTRLDGSLSDLSLNNDAANVFRREIEAKFNQEFGKRNSDMLNGANTKLKSMAGEQQLPGWVNIMLSQLK